jgi:hypothetical protein
MLLYLSLHPNYQQKDPHVSFFYFLLSPHPPHLPTPSSLSPLHHSTPTPPLLPPPPRPRAHGGAPSAAALVRMAEPRPPPPSGGGSHGGDPSAADRIEDRRMRRPRPPSLPVADPVGGAPLLAGRERPADPVPPPGTGVSPGTAPAVVSPDTGPTVLPAPAIVSPGTAELGFAGSAHPVVPPHPAARGLVVLALAVEPRR